MKRIKGISRIDSEKKKMHGWYVRVYGGGKTFAKYFSDHRYGGKQKGLKEAIVHLEKLTEEIRAKFADYSRGSNQPKYWRKPGKANTSGVVGVHRCNTVCRGRPVSCWVATWNEGGKRRDKAFYFSDKFRSEEEAKRMAIEWRAKKILELSGETPPEVHPDAPTSFSRTKHLTGWVPGLVIKGWNPSLKRGELDTSRQIKLLERFSKKRIEELKAFLGIAATHFDWSDIDYQFGRGIFKRDIRSRCFWNHDGIRTDIIVEKDGRLSVQQGITPDPFYLAEKKKERPNMSRHHSVRE